MNRSASPSLFGYDFQVNAAIVLMLENIEQLDTLRVEGAKEDIEIKLNDNTYVLAQAKSVVNSSSDFKEVKQKFKKALASLSDAANTIKSVRQLIYITNSPNPLNDKASFPLFYGAAHRSISSLPESTRNMVNCYLSKIDNALDPSLLTIQILPFETNDEKERYKEVLRVISDFLDGFDLPIEGLRKRLHKIWKDSLHFNSSQTDISIVLKKKDIVWPVIVCVTEKGAIERDGPYCSNLDENEYGLIQRKYHELIDSCSERFEFAIKVISEYNNYPNKTKDGIALFVADKWDSFSNEFDFNCVDERVKEALIKVIVSTVLRNRLEINEIKKKVKL